MGGSSNVEERPEEIEAALGSVNKLFENTMSLASNFPNSSLAEARTAAEAICQYILDKNDINPDGKQLDKMIKQLDTKKIIPGKIVMQLRTIQGQGNYGPHNRYRDSDNFTEKDIQPCLKSLEILVDWYFSDYHNQTRISIKQILKNKPKDLAPFTPVKLIMNSGRYKEIFKEELIFFSNDDETKIGELCDCLAQNHIALLKGHQGSGKSVMALRVAEEMKQKSYQTYYLRFESESDSDSVVKVIKSVKHQNIVFILDDCHLRMDSVQKIWTFMNTYHDSGRACLLYVSREIKINPFNKIFDLFTELKDETFSSETPKKQQKEKLKEIVNKYHIHLKKTNPQKSYEVGNVQNIFANICGDLFILSMYLDLWEEQGGELSNINKKKLLCNVYEAYWEKLNQREQAYLLRYVSLYYFEIKFQSLPKTEDKEATTQLFKRFSKEGLIVSEENFFAFSHSSFAKLLLDAYISENRNISKGTFKRKHENILFFHIKEYIFSYENYPENLHTILRNLFSTNVGEKINGQKILEKLFQDKDIKESIIRFYSKEKDASYLSNFFVYLSECNKEGLQYFYEKLIANNSDRFKSILFESQYPTLNCYIMLHSFGNNESLKNKFSEYLNKTLLSKSDLIGIARTIDFLQSVKNWAGLGGFKELFKQLEGLCNNIVNQKNVITS